MFNLIESTSTPKTNTKIKKTKIGESVKTNQFKREEEPCPYGEECYNFDEENPPKSRCWKNHGKKDTRKNYKKNFKRGDTNDATSVATDDTPTKVGNSESKVCCFERSIRECNFAMECRKFDPDNQSNSTCRFTHPGDNRPIYKKKADTMNQPTNNLIIETPSAMTLSPTDEAEVLREFIEFQNFKKLREEMSLHK
jgi:hypothetical protein